MHRFLIIISELGKDLSKPKGCHILTTQSKIGKHLSLHPFLRTRGEKRRRKKKSNSTEIPSNSCEPADFWPGKCTWEKAASFLWWWWCVWGISEEMSFPRKSLIRIIIIMQMKLLFPKCIFTQAVTIDPEDAYQGPVQPANGHALAIMKSPWHRPERYSARCLRRGQWIYCDSGTGAVLLVIWWWACTAATARLAACSGEPVWPSGKASGW